MLIVIMVIMDIMDITDIAAVMESDTKVEAATVVQTPTVKNADTSMLVNKIQLLFVNLIKNSFYNQHQLMSTQESTNHQDMLTLPQESSPNKVVQMFKLNQLLLRLKKKVEAKWFADTNI